MPPRGRPGTARRRAVRVAFKKTVCLGEGRLFTSLPVLLASPSSPFLGVCGPARCLEGRLGLGLVEGRVPWRRRRRRGARRG